MKPSLIAVEINRRCQEPISQARQAGSSHPQLVEGATMWFRLVSKHVSLGRNDLLCRTEAHLIHWM